MGIWKKLLIKMSNNFFKILCLKKCFLPDLSNCIFYNDKKFYRIFFQIFPRKAIFDKKKRNASKNAQNKIVNCQSWYISFIKYMFPWKTLGIISIMGIIRLSFSGISSILIRWKFFNNPIFRRRILKNGFGTRKIPSFFEIILS